MVRPTFVALMGSGLLMLAGSLAAQTPDVSSAVPCAEKPPLECPYGSSGSWYTSINLKMLQNNSGQMACMFDRSNMDPSPGPSLRVDIGGDGIFDVCNACDVDVTVQFDTWSVPWQQGFSHTFPPASADGTVSQDVPCRDRRSVNGYDANAPETAKGWVRVKNKGAASFHDDLDPELEIEGGLKRFARQFGMWGVSGLLALLALWALSRRRSVS